MSDRKRKIPKIEDHGSCGSSIVFMRQTPVEHHAQAARDGQASDNPIVADTHEHTVRDMMESFREELAQTINPRFEMLEHHIVSINARLATATDSTNAVVTTSAENTTTHRHAPNPAPKPGPTGTAWDYADLALPAGSFFSTPVHVLVHFCLFLFLFRLFHQNPLFFLSRSHDPTSSHS